KLMMTGSNVYTCDFRKESSVGGSDYPTMGILGMDVLEHYCIQLDFESRKVRFVKSQSVSAEKSGTPFRLDLPDSDRRAFISCGSLLGTEKKKVLVDTGFQADGAADEGRFDELVREHHLKLVSGCALFPKCDWNSGAYTNLIILKGEPLLGLRFL